MTTKPHPIDVIVGANIRHRRALVGMSQTELGDEIGVTFQQVQKYENAMNRISASRLWDCAKALDVPLERLFENPPR